MFSQVNGVGRVASIEVKKSDKGTIVNFSFATNNKYKKTDGEKVEETTFIDCVAFGALAEKVIAPHVKKGDQLFIRADLKQENWEKEGQKRSKHVLVVEDIEMLGGKKEEK